MAAVESLVDLATFVRNPGTANTSTAGQQPTSGSNASSSPGPRYSEGLLNKLGPPFAFCIWVAARMALVHYSTIEKQMSPSIYTLLDTLREMGRYWKVAERYASLLTRVLDEYEGSARVPRDNTERPGTPTAVKILADMRRTAFDLDFLISRQPRAPQQQQQQQHSSSVSRSSGGPTPAQPGNMLAQHSGMETLSAAAVAVRQPQQNELEYLDVFDFFNMPRLPAGFEGVGGYGDGSGGPQAGQGAPGGVVNGGNTEFNYNYMVDANSDWFVKDST